jgi:hypothetical protein
VCASGAPMRTHDVSELSFKALAEARRELAVSRALSRPDSPIQLPISAELLAIDAELVSRGVKICSCGLATDDAEMLDGHLFEYPVHQERDLGRYFAAGR